MRLPVPIIPSHRAWNECTPQVVGQVSMAGCHSNHTHTTTCHVTVRCTSRLINQQKQKTRIW